MYYTVNANYYYDVSPAGFWFSLIILAITLAGFWRMFTKAKQPGWAAIIPIYNIYIILKITNKPWWWLLLLLIPLVNFFVIIMIMYNLAQAFGRGLGSTLLLVLLPFIGAPMLGFGSAKYKRPPKNS